VVLNCQKEKREKNSNERICDDYNYQKKKKEEIIGDLAAVSKRQ
jgi:hypothetical protein